VDYTGEIEVKEYFFECDGSIPNNSTPPLLVYPGVLVESDPDASRCKRLLSGNGWSGVFGLIIALSPRRLSASSSASALRSALELRHDRLPLGVELRDQLRFDRCQRPTSYRRHRDTQLPMIPRSLSQLLLYKPESSLSCSSIRS